ncbi:MAG: lysophospholipid acyltransferase family protein [Bacteroidota bacterium]
MISTGFSKWLLNLLGWKITGRYPEEIKKFIIIVLPHTSNWDFPLGLLVRKALKQDIKYLGKSSLFKPPFGWIFKSLGGYPVFRDKRTKFVDAVIDIFKKEEELVITVAPEGTRSKVEKLKTGFYYMALGANIPVCLVKFDYGNKEVDFGKLLYPSGNIEEDLAIIHDHYRGVKGKRPEKSFLSE